MAHHVLDVWMTKCNLVLLLNHSILTNLFALLHRTNMEDLREKTHSIHYELYRRNKLTAMGFTDISADNRPVRSVVYQHQSTVGLFNFLLCVVCSRRINRNAVSIWRRCRPGKKGWDRCLSRRYSYVHINAIYVAKRKFSAGHIIKKILLTCEYHTMLVCRWKTKKPSWRHQSKNFTTSLNACENSTQMRRNSWMINEPNW